MREERIYLDTSVLAKRYVEEEGTKEVDLVFEKAERGEAIILFSAWNIGEIAVVLDKYEKKNLLDARKVLEVFLDEMERMVRQRAVKVVQVSNLIIIDAIMLVLKYHMYLADSIQIVSSKVSTASTFMTADSDLANVARIEGKRAMKVATLG